MRDPEIVRAVFNLERRVAAMERSSRGEFASIELPDDGGTIDVTEALQTGMAASLDAHWALVDASVAQTAADNAIAAGAAAQLAADSAVAAANNIGPTQITDDAIQTRHVTALAIQAAHIAAGAIQAGHLAAASVQAGNVAAGAIQTADLAAVAVTADKIAANAITAAKIAADAIDGKTITGAVIRTAPALSPRVEVNGTDGAREVRFYGLEGNDGSYAVMRQDYNSGSAVRIETPVVGTIGAVDVRSRYVISPVVQGLYLRYWNQGSPEPSTDNASVRVYKAIGESVGSVEMKGDTIDLVAPNIAVSSPIVPPTPWTAPAFAASFANFDGGFHQAGYMRDASGVVHLRGVVKWTSGTASSGTVNIFTLPAGLRPSGSLDHIFISATNAGGTFKAARVNVRDTGEVQFDANSGALASGQWVSLDGISFRP